ncbi:hypothetical protein M426DRAFT_12765 [Hypoxylon sp. CI-4A]|nr:hypothetical protein M426DRAFT_12765 [Hypoxylon sp. CI-4A]
MSQDLWHPWCLADDAERPPDTNLIDSHEGFCDKCQKLVNHGLDYLFSEGRVGYRSVEHHESYVGLEAAASSGCEVCKIIQELRLQKRTREEELLMDEFFQNSGLPSSFSFKLSDGSSIYEGNLMVNRTAVYPSNQSIRRLGLSQAKWELQGIFEGAKERDDIPIEVRNNIYPEFEVMKNQHRSDLDLYLVSGGETYFQRQLHDGSFLDHRWEGRSSPRAFKLKAIPELGYPASSHPIYTPGNRTLGFTSPLPLWLRHVRSTPTLGLGRAWLQACLSAHDCCPKLQDRPLPSRLLHISKDMPDKLSVKLVECNGKSGKYLTLSHCWGTRPILAKTIKSNYKAYLNDIPYDELPKTFQDAVYIAKELGFEYIWIDSMCIIQDDGADWARECQKMAAVYSNSVMTLASPAATDAYHGMLHTREYPTPSQQIPIYRRGRPEATMAINKLHPWGEDEKYWMDAGCQLRSRGWVLQERLLSPRTLYLGSRQMYFECGRDEFHERGSKHTTDDEQQRREGTHHVRLKTALADDADAADTRAGWFRIVATYSRCSLTEGRDALPALSGMARHVQSLTGDEYCAGVFKKDLLPGIMWNCTDRTCPTRCFKKPEHKGPSWSWVHCDRPVAFNHSDSGDSVAEIIDVRVTPAWDDPFGQIIDGRITLRAELYECRVAVTLDTCERFSIEKSTLLIDGDDNSTDIFFAPDSPELEPGTAVEFSDDGTASLPVTFIMLSTTSLVIGSIDLTNVSMHGIIALSTDQEDTYRRIGYVNLSREYGEAFGTRTEPQVVKLV